MESYRTEEEQVEALRKWWQENSKSTLAAIVFAIAAGFGWQEWRQQQLLDAQAASAIYQDLLEAVAVADGVEFNEAGATTAKHLAGTLKEEYGSSTYAQFASLQLVKLAVVESDLAVAETELRWVLRQNPDQDIQRITQLRLARVMTAQGESQLALDMLATEAGDYQSVYAETKGDIYRQMGQADNALAAYQQASAQNKISGRTNTASLDLKLQSLQLEPARAAGALANEE